MAAADHHLLFGLLALQNGLIDQAELVAAFHAWTRDKSRSLADHLLALGLIDPDGRSALEAMAGLHLKKHGGDVERSLGAIPAGRSTREDLGGINDPQIDATLTLVGSGSGSIEDADPNETAAYSVGSATSAGQRFRVLRPHARGGLGAVYVALDGELHREVALKQILELHADDPASRQRFLLEAEVTGGLEHPGIVPVYGLGTDEEGRPYYAMRFVKGDSLKEALAKFHADGSLATDPGRRSLEFRQLLRRFTDVCNAIDYAHSRGIIHRDIKPGNVIVGRFGETLVVDWGLAKPLGRVEPGSGSDGERTLNPMSASGSEATLPGRALGTPAFMAPEQAAGDLDRLGPRSDVYGLGATLYCLLTGRAPFEGDVFAVLKAVQNGDVTPPRKREPTIDPALEAVCLKAMALRPEDRYDTARALAEDVDRWIADEPVTARRDPWTRRLARWARRHRTAAAALGLSMATAVVLLAISNLVVNQARRETARALEQVREEQGRTRSALARADASFHRARQAVDEYFTAISRDVLLDEPGMQPLRKTLLGSALRYHEAFLRERGDDPSVEAELAQSQRQYGNISLSFAGPKESEHHLRAAVSRWDQLIKRLPDHREYRRQRALTRADLALALGVLADDRPAQIAVSREAIDELRGFLRDGGPEETVQSMLAMTLASLGLRRSVEPDGSAEALRLVEESRAILVKLVADHPDSSYHRIRLADVHQLLYDCVIGDAARQTEALEASEAAIQTILDLIKKHPNSPRFRGKAGNLLTTRGLIHRRAERFAPAIVDLNQARVLLADVVRANPDVPSYLASQAWASSVLGDCLMKSGDRHRALIPYREACEGFERYMALRPENIPARGMYLSALTGLSADLADLCLFDESVKVVRRTIALAAKFVEVDPMDIFTRGDWIISQLNLGLALTRADRHPEAVAAYDDYETLMRDNPGFDSSHGGLKVIEYLVPRAISLREIGRVDEARAIVAEARENRSTNPGTLVQLAIFDARGVDLLERAGGDPASVQAAEDRAWDSLVLAVRSGFENVIWLQRLAPFERLRRRPEFATLALDAAFPAEPFLPD